MNEEKEAIERSKKFKVLEKKISDLGVGNHMEEEAINKVVLFAYRLGLDDGCHIGRKNRE